MPLDFNSPHLRVVDGLDKDEIKRRLESDIRNVVLKLYPQVKIRPGARDVRIADPSGDPGNSMSIALTSDVPGQWIDHATDEKGDVFTLIERALGLSSFSEVLKEANALAGGTLTSRQSVHQAEQRAKPPAPKKTKIDEVQYVYTTATGDPIVTVHKNIYEGGKKDFRIYRHSDGSWKAPVVRPLYNIPGIIKADTVVFVEGEKCAQALIDQGVTATCIMGGAKAPLEKNDFSPLEGKNVIIWPDNDEAGFGLSGRVKNVLNGLVNSTRVVDIPRGKPEGWDVADAVEAGEDVTAYLGTSKRRKVPILTVPEVVNRPLPEYLIKDMLIEGGLSSFYAPSSTYKSFIALDLALSVSTGVDWRGMETKGGPVVYIASEGMGGWGKRLLVWLEHRGEGNDPQFFTVPTSFDFSEADQRAGLQEAIDSVCEKPALIVIDTLARNFGGGDENSTKDMGAFISGMDALREATGAHVMLVHHTGKDKERGARGSSALYGALDAEMTVAKDEINSRLIEFKVTKMKDGNDDLSMRFEMVEIEAVHPATGEVITSLVPVISEPESLPTKPNPEEDKLLDFLRERTRTTKEVAKYLSISDRGAGKKLQKMADKGQIFLHKAEGVNYWNFYDVWNSTGTEKDE